MKQFLLATLMWGVGTLGFAQTQEQLGNYRPSLPIYGLWDCENVGVKGGAISVQADRVVLIGEICTLENPVPIRDMDGILFDATCTPDVVATAEAPQEPEITTERLLLMWSVEELHIISPRGGSSWHRCGS